MRPALEAGVLPVLCIPRLAEHLFLTPRSCDFRAMTVPQGRSYDRRDYDRRGPPRRPSPPPRGRDLVRGRGDSRYARRSPSRRSPPPPRRRSRSPTGDDSREKEGGAGERGRSRSPGHKKRKKEKKEKKSKKHKKHSRDDKDADAADASSDDDDDEGDDNNEGSRPDDGDEDAGKGEAPTDVPELEPFRDAVATSQDDGAASS